MAETSTAAPLLTRQGAHDSSFGSVEARPLSTLSIFLGLFAGRRGASMIVRENAAEQLEEWRDNWGYSFPVVVIDTMWNLAFVVVSIVMLCLTAQEEPKVPVRAWICVYAMQCIVHVVLVWLEYKRRNRIASTGISFEVGDFTGPDLMRVTLTFMAIDVFFPAIGCLKALITGLVVCFCFPCVIAFLYFMGGQGGASEAEIKVLPKYRFEVSNKPIDVGGKMVPFKTNGPDFSHEHVVLREDADCCICLRPYEDGTELHVLPCKHPFHVTCIVKWLKISRTCPLCKYTITQAAQV